MKSLFTQHKQKFLRWLYGTLSFSTALFVFQACYGTPNDGTSDVYIEGLCKAASSDQPIEGIKVSLVNQPQYTKTDSEGKFRIYASLASEYKILCEDVDSTRNGAWLPADTTLKMPNEGAFLTISLHEK